MSLVMGHKYLPRCEPPAASSPTPWPLLDLVTALHRGDEPVAVAKERKLSTWPALAESGPNKRLKRNRLAHKHK